MLTKSLRHPTSIHCPRVSLLRLGTFALATAMLLCVDRVGWAQPAEKKDGAAATAQPKTPAPGAAQPKRTKSDKEIDLTPVDVGGNDLMTQDGVQLRAMFYPGSKGKQSVPVILLHSYKGDRKEFNTLAPFLQQQGHAVLVPDLRGHGESTNTRAGVKLDATKMPADQFEAMVYKDLPTLKRFLTQKNDEGALNLSKLCVVGSEFGALVAVNFARYDWTPLSYGDRPPMDVRALVLISPPRTQFGLQLQSPLNANPEMTRSLSILLLVGKEKGSSRLADEVKRFYNTLKKYHPDPSEEEKAEKTTLFHGEMPTKLQGSKMLGVKTLKVETYIAHFIELRLAKQTSPEFNWRERKK